MCYNVIIGVKSIMSTGEVQYVSNGEGDPVAVLVPIDLWREIASERETAYLLKSAAMSKRLADARASSTSIPLKEVRAKCGL